MWQKLDGRQEEEANSACIGERIANAAREP
jgi:hypothetical protein